MGEQRDALEVLLRMDQQGTVPSVETYRALLGACTERRASAYVKQVYAHLVKCGLQCSEGLGDFVVEVLVRCGSLKDAVVIFQELPCKTVVSWRAMIRGHTNAGQGREGLRLYECMVMEDVVPDRYTFLSLLKLCGSLAELERGKHIHAEVLKHGYERDDIMATSIIDMYAKCGSIVDAHHVFDRLSQKDVIAWNALLSGYAQGAHGVKALQLYKDMLVAGVSANDRTFVSTIHLCGSLAEKEERVVVNGLGIKVEALQIGKYMHYEAYRKGYCSDMFVGNTLIGMYGKCGSISDAKHVFDGLFHRDVVSWNIMIGAYAQQERGEAALVLYVKMLEEGVSPDARSFVNLLQAFSSQSEKEQTGMGDEQLFRLESLQIGKALHAEAQKRGYEVNVFLGSALVSLYAKCGSILDAQSTFDSLPQRNVVLWNAILAGYAQQGEGGKALLLYEQMQKGGVEANDRTLVSALQACASIAENEELLPVDGHLLRIMSMQKGKAIHAEAQRQGHEADTYIGSTLISMYARCGSISDAEHVFQNLLQRSIISWNAMLAGYAHYLPISPVTCLQSLVQVALELYVRMSQQGVKADAWTIVSILQACGRLAEEEVKVLVDGQLLGMDSLQKVKAIHVEARNMCYKADVFVINALVSVYGKCGSVLDAQNIFDGVFKRDVVSWNSILAACAQQGFADHTFELYGQMMEEGMSPDDRTFVSTLQACGTLADNEERTYIDGQATKVQSIQKGRAVHAKAWSTRYKTDLFVSNSLICMYGKCGSIADAEIVFDCLPHRDIVSWNAMLGAYVQQGKAEEAVKLYEQLLECGNPDERTFASALQACGMLADLEEYDVHAIDGPVTKMKSLLKGKAIHIEAWERGHKSNLFIGNSLVTMYGKCGAIVDAHNVFDALPQRNVLSWNAILGAYAELAQPHQALELYDRMLEEGGTPNDVTFLYMLQACSILGNLDVCIQIQQHILSSGNNLSLAVANTLIHAFGRCASMVKAQEVFDALPHPDVVSWNALIAGYARQGKEETSFECYEKMRSVGGQPDAVTFLTLLSACSHAGRVGKGVAYFDSMTRNHGLIPEVHHYVSLVDMLSRAGYFTMVEDLLSTMPMKPNRCLWLCLLGACRKHGNITLGRVAFDQTLRLEPRHAAAYILMSNIYAHAGMWDDAQKVNELRQQASAWKNPGQSWIEHEEEVHQFVVGEHRHDQQDLICDLLEDLTSIITRFKSGHTGNCLGRTTRGEVASTA